MLDHEVFMNGESNNNHRQSEKHSPEGNDHFNFLCLAISDQDGAQMPSSCLIWYPFGFSDQLMCNVLLIQERACRFHSIHIKIVYVSIASHIQNIILSHKVYVLARLYVLRYGIAVYTCENEQIPRELLGQLTLDATADLNVLYSSGFTIVSTQSDARKHGEKAKVVWTHRSPSLAPTVWISKLSCWQDMSWFF
jgi:hypothetical protein